MTNENRGMKGYGAMVDVTAPRIQRVLQIIVIVMRYYKQRSQKQISIV